MKNINWKMWGLAFVGIVTAMILAAWLKEQWDLHRLKKSTIANPATDVPMTESTATGQLLSPVR